MHSFVPAVFSPIAMSTGVPKSFSAPMLRASKTLSQRDAQFTSAATKRAFSAFALPATHADPALTSTYGLLTKKTSHQFPKLQQTPPNIDSALTSHRKPKNSRTLFHHLIATYLLQIPSKVSPQKAPSTNQLNSLSPSKMLIFSHNWAGFHKLSLFLSWIGLPLGYRRGLLPYMHLPSGIQYGLLTLTTFHYKNSMLSSFYISHPSSFMMHAPKQTMVPSSPPTDQLSVHDYVKPKRGFGFPSWTTLYRLTLNISSKPPPRNPPGRPGASEPFTNPYLAAGVSHSELYKKTAARHPHKRLLKKYPPSSFAHQSHHKKKTSSSQPLPNPDALATNT